MKHQSMKTNLTFPLVIKKRKKKRLMLGISNKLQQLNNTWHFQGPLQTV